MDKQLAEKVKGVSTDEELGALGFECIGHLAEITNNPNHERVWLWSNAEGDLVTTFDEGNCYCHVESVMAVAA